MAFCQLPKPYTGYQKRCKGDCEQNAEVKPQKPSLSLYLSEWFSSSIFKLSPELNQSLQINPIVSLIVTLERWENIFRQSRRVFIKKAQKRKLTPEESCLDKQFLASNKVDFEEGLPPGDKFFIDYGKCNADLTKNIGVYVPMDGSQFYPLATSSLEMMESTILHFVWGGIYRYAEKQEANQIQWRFFSGLGNKGPFRMSLDPLEDQYLFTINGDLYGIYAKDDNQTKTQDNTASALISDESSVIAYHFNFQDFQISTHTWDFSTLGFNQEAILHGYYTIEMADKIQKFHALGQPCLVKNEEGESLNLCKIH